MRGVAPRVARGAQQAPVESLMHLTLLLAGALVPGALAGELASAIKAPHLAARLARAALIEDITAVEPLRGAAHLSWLNPRIFGTHVDAPTAPYAFAALSGDRPRAGLQLFHADLIHLGFARDHLVVESLAVAPSAAERAALRRSAEPVLREAGTRLIEASDSEFLQADVPWQLSTVPLAVAAGGPASALLTSGSDAVRWSRLHNEIQMIWHSHPVNQAREERGEEPINGVWLHGGGQWEPLPTPPYSTVNADAPELRGAALAAGLNSGSAAASAIDNALVVRTDPFDSLSHGDWRDWLGTIARIDSWLAPLATATIDLVLAGRDTVRTRRSTPWDRFRRWRALPLAEAISE